MDTAVYLDNNSTTPVDPIVLEAMLPFFTTHFGNPSNTLHSFGIDAANAVEKARTEVATLLGASPREIVFTSGATESNNLAILGACRFHAKQRRHVVVSAIEHKAVLEACHQLQREGHEVTYIPVDRWGVVSLEALEQAVTTKTALVSVMAANNEVGTIEPMMEVGQLCQERGALFHSDAVQATGRIPIDVDEWKVDLLSVSGHKAYGPKGVGALYIRQHGAKFGLAPLVFGGGQERGLRSGTLAVPQIVGLGRACTVARERLSEEPIRITKLRNTIKDRLTAAIPEAVIHGHPEHSLPGLLSIGFPGVDGDVLMQLLIDVAASQGSSCSAGSSEPSHVLRAMGVHDELAKATLRLGVGRFNALEEISLASNSIISAVMRARSALVPQG